jgi:hypothetical protein
MKSSGEGHAVLWEITANLGPQGRPGVDGRGWLWEISRGDQVARVMIEISGSAWSANPLDLPEDTRRALETDGRTELLKVLGQEDPPRVIRCGSTGCRYRWPRDQGTDQALDGGDRRRDLRW